MTSLVLTTFRWLTPIVGSVGRSCLFTAIRSIALWNEQVAALSTSYRVIAPDLRGFGESDASDGPATMNRMAQDVALLLNHLGITRATIGGLSMGGYVASRFTNSYHRACAH